MIGAERKSMVICFITFSDGICSAGSANLSLKYGLRRGKKMIEILIGIWIVLGLIYSGYLIGRIIHLKKHTKELDKVLALQDYYQNYLCILEGIIAEKLEDQENVEEE